MKRKLIHLLPVFIFMILLFNGCKKDNGPDNYMRVDKKAYNLSKGYCLGYGHSSDYLGYDVQMVLVSSGISYNDSWSGKGNLLWISFGSASANSLPGGTYSYSSSYPFSNQSFTGGSSWTIGMNTADESSCQLTDGDITVINYGNNLYEFTASCVDFDGNTVIAHFKGTVTFWDMTGK